MKQEHARRIRAIWESILHTAPRASTRRLLDMTVDKANKELATPYDAGHVTEALHATRAEMPWAGDKTTRTSGGKTP